jgi:hypothetical protein
MLYYYLILRKSDRNKPIVTPVVGTRVILIVCITFWKYTSVQNLTSSRRNLEYIFQADISPNSLPSEFWYWHSYEGQCGSLVGEIRLQCKRVVRSHVLSEKTRISNRPTYTKSWKSTMVSNYLRRFTCEKTKFVYSSNQSSIHCPITWARILSPFFLRANLFLFHFLSDSSFVAKPPEGHKFCVTYRLDFKLLPLTDTHIAGRFWSNYMYMCFSKCNCGSEMSGVFFFFYFFFRVENCALIVGT